MHKQRWMVSVTLLAALLAGGLAACGDKKSDNNGGGNDSGVAEVVDSVETEITAKDGGKVELTEAGITLDIPAGALDKDTTITAKTIAKADLPDSKDALGNAVEFGPDGLEFSKPVKLTIDLGGAKIPEDATATISWLDEKTDKWVDLEGSKVAGGAVTAETTHFTIFLIRVVFTEDGGQQTAGTCPAFKACGGDVEGTWVVEKGCADVPQSLLKEYATALMCPSAIAELGIDITGEITLADGKITGELNIESVQKLTLPKSCVGGKCEEGDAEKGEVVVEKGDLCESTTTQTKVSDPGGTYEIDGNSITITSAEDAQDEKDDGPAEFCVTGDTLVISQPTENGVIVQWTAKRQ